MVSNEAILWLCVQVLWYLDFLGYAAKSSSMGMVWMHSKDMWCFLWMNMLCLPCFFSLKPTVWNLFTSQYIVDFDELKTNFWICCDSFCRIYIQVTTVHSCVWWSFPVWIFVTRTERMYMWLHDFFDCVDKIKFHI